MKTLKQILPIFIVSVLCFSIDATAQEIGTGNETHVATFHENFYFSDFSFKADTLPSSAMLNINWKSKIAKKYEGLIRDEIVHGQRKDFSFAGHYGILSVGAGEVIDLYVIDFITGNIYPGPVTSHGFKFYGNSKLLKIDMPDDPTYGKWYPDCISCGSPKLFVWNDNNHKFYLIEDAMEEYQDKLHGKKPVNSRWKTPLWLSYQKILNSQLKKK